MTFKETNKIFKEIAPELKVPPRVQSETASLDNSKNNSLELPPKNENFKLTDEQKLAYLKHQEAKRQEELGIFGRLTASIRSGFHNIWCRVGEISSLCGVSVVTAANHPKATLKYMLAAVRGNDVEGDVDVKALRKDQIEHVNAVYSIYEAKSQNGSVLKELLAVNSTESFSLPNNLWFGVKLGANLALSCPIDLLTVPIYSPLSWMGEEIAAKKYRDSKGNTVSYSTYLLEGRDSEQVQNILLGFSIAEFSIASVITVLTAGRAGYTAVTNTGKAAQFLSKISAFKPFTNWLLTNQHKVGRLLNSYTMSGLNAGGNYLMQDEKKRDVRQTATAFFAGTAHSAAFGMWLRTIGGGLKGFGVNQKTIEKFTSRTDKLDAGTDGLEVVDDSRLEVNKFLVSGQEINSKTFLNVLLPKFIGAGMRATSTVMDAYDLSPNKDTQVVVNNEQNLNKTTFSPKTTLEQKLNIPGLKVLEYQKGYIVGEGFKYCSVMLCGIPGEIRLSDNGQAIYVKDPNLLRVIALIDHVQKIESYYPDKNELELLQIANQEIPQRINGYTDRQGRLIIIPLDIFNSTREKRINEGSIIAHEDEHSRQIKVGLTLDSRTAESLARKRERDYQLKANDQSQPTLNEVDDAKDYANRPYPIAASANTVEGMDNLDRSELLEKIRDLDFMAIAKRYFLEAREILENNKAIMGSQAQYDLEKELKLLERMLGLGESDNLEIVVKRELLKAKAKAEKGNVAGATVNYETAKKIATTARDSLDCSRMLLWISNSQADYGLLEQANETALMIPDSCYQTRNIALAQIAKSTKPEKIIEKIPPSLMGYDEVKKFVNEERLKYDINYGGFMRHILEPAVSELVQRRMYEEAISLVIANKSNRFSPLMSFEAKALLAKIIKTQCEFGDITQAFQTIMLVPDLSGYWSELATVMISKRRFAEAEIMFQMQQARTEDAFTSVIERIATVAKIIDLYGITELTEDELQRVLTTCPLRVLRDFGFLYPEAIDTIIAADSVKLSADRKLVLVLGIEESRKVQDPKDPLFEDYKERIRAAIKNNEGATLNAVMIGLEKQSTEIAVKILNNHIHETITAIKNLLSSDETVGPSQKKEVRRLEKDLIRLFATILPHGGHRTFAMATGLFTQCSLSAHAEYLAKHMFARGYWDLKLGNYLNEKITKGESKAEIYQILKCIISDIGLVPDLETYQLLEKPGLLKAKNLEARLQELKKHVDNFRALNKRRLDRELAYDKDQALIYHVLFSARHNYASVNRFSFQNFQQLVSLANDLDVSKERLLIAERAFRAGGLSWAEAVRVVQRLIQGKPPKSGNRVFEITSSGDFAAQIESNNNRFTAKVWNTELSSILLCSCNGQMPIDINQALNSTDNLAKSPKYLAIQRQLRLGELNNISDLKALIVGFKNHLKSRGKNPAELSQMTEVQVIEEFLKDRIGDNINSPAFLEWKSHLSEVLESSLLLKNKSGSGKETTYEVTILDKEIDYFRAYRFANAKTCCFTADHIQQRGKYVAALNKDPLSFIIDIKEKGSDLISGFVFGRTGIDPTTGKPVIMLNGVYSQDMREGLVQGVLDIVEREIAKPLGASAILLKAVTGGTLSFVPKGYENTKALKIEAIRALSMFGQLQTELYDDIGKVANGVFEFDGLIKKLKSKERKRYSFTQFIEDAFEVAKHRLKSFLLNRFS